MWCETAHAATTDLIHDTYNGLIAFVVPGPDDYSVSQGVSTVEMGGIDTGVIDVLIGTIDQSAPYLPQFSAVTAGILGAAMTTWVTFTPSMLWIFAGAPFVEQLRGNRHLSGALAAITAAVVGVILNLTVWFALHVLFGQVAETRVGWLRYFAFDPLSLDLRASALAVIAAVLAFGLHRSLIEVVGVMAALGVVVKLVFG